MIKSKEHGLDFEVDKELYVDFIGGEGTLTAEEEKALSAYFQQKKQAKLATKKQATKNKVASSKQTAETA